MNLCIIGDSITWGARLPARISWANLLRNYLEAGSDHSIAVYDIGVDGDTSVNVLSRFDTEITARNPEVILIAVGINDSLYRKIGEFETPLPQFRNNVLALISKAKKVTKIVLWVGLVKGDDLETTPLLRSSTGKCYNKESVKLYDKEIERICLGNNVTFVSLFNKLNDSDFYDGLHPNANGHNKIFDEVRKSLENTVNLDTKFLFTLVDVKDKEIGYKKREAIDPNDIVRVAALWVVNNKNEVLIAKRATTKKRDPGKWGPAAASLVKKDETYQKCALESARNELGLSNILLVESKKMFLDGENKFFCQWYLYKENLETKDLKLNSNEVLEVKWVEGSQLIEDVKKTPHKYVQAFYDYCKFLN